MKLMVAIPTLDYVHFNFTRCLVGLTQRLERLGIEYEICFLGGTLVYLGRDNLATEAVNKGFSHVLWLDADMVFDPDVFERLLKHEKPFVTGLYASRHAPYLATVFKSLAPECKTFDTVPKEGLFEIEACGFGIVLMETKVILDVYRKCELMFQPFDAHGEDIMFCKRAREAGYTLYCDPTVRAGHIGHVTVYPNVKETE